jgi:hypothetical protein
MRNRTKGWSLVRAKSKVILSFAVLTALVLLGELVGQKWRGRPHPLARAAAVAPEGEGPEPAPSPQMGTDGQPTGPTSPTEPLGTAGEWAPSAGDERTEPLDPSPADLDQPERSQVTGNLTDLTPQQEKRAMDLWLDEARKWAALKGFSADVEIQRVDREGKELLSLRATAVLRVKETPRDRINYQQGTFSVTHELTLRDPEGKWEYRSDGTVEGTALTCADPKLLSQLRPYLDAGIGQIVSTPNVVLSHLHTDKMGGPESLACFKAYQPMKHPEGQTGKPDCYMYGPPLPHPPENVVLFEEGRFRYWADGLYGHERVKVLFGGYEAFGGFEFPTEMIARWQTQGVMLRFSKLTIDSSR